MGDLERDVERVQTIYHKPPYSYRNVSQDINKKLNDHWFSEAWTFMKEITDISEEFHREYYKFYRHAHWIRVVEYQTKISDKFFEDVFNDIGNDCKAILIKYNKVSQKFVDDNKDSIPVEVWEKIYV
jgi:hypothetical protein